MLKYPKNFRIEQAQQAMPLIFNATEIAAVEGYAAQFSVVRVGDASQLELAWLCTEDLPKYRLYSAKQGVDYEPIDKSITFEPGERQQDFNIQIYNNRQLDLERHFYVLIVDIFDTVCPIDGAKNSDRYDRGDTVAGTLLKVRIIDTD